jgi:hypothetical protein
MKGLAFLIGVLLLAAAVEGATFRDGSGRMVGNSHDHGKQTIYRDSSGRIKGSAHKEGHRTVFRDSTGRIKGSVNPAASQPYRDAWGMSKTKKSTR